MKLKDILQNPNKGAAELLRSAVAFLSQHPDCLNEMELDAILHMLRKKRPAMVGFSVLADRIEHDLDAFPEKTPERIIHAIQADIHEADNRTAARFAEFMEKEGPRSLVTLSWSSAVRSSLAAAAEWVSALHVLESNPGGEGQETYAACSEFLKEVHLHFDEDISDAVSQSDIGVIGADTVFADGAVLNKVLSARLAGKLREEGKPLYVVATSWKRSKATSEGYHSAEADANLFEIVPAELIKEVISEM